jgi:hypothetical protein
MHSSDGSDVKPRISDDHAFFGLMIGPFEIKLTRFQNQYTDLGHSGIWWFTANAGETMHFELNSMIAKDVEGSSFPLEPVVAVEPIVKAEPLLHKTEISQFDSN